MQFHLSWRNLKPPAKWTTKWVIICAHRQEIISGISWESRFMLLKCCWLTKGKNQHAKELSDNMYSFYKTYFLRLQVRQNKYKLYNNNLAAIFINEISMVKSTSCVIIARHASSLLGARHQRVCSMVLTKAQYN